MKGKVSRIGIMFLVIGLCLAGVSVCFAAGVVGTEGAGTKEISVSAGQAFLPANEALNLEEGTKTEDESVNVDACITKEEYDQQNASSTQPKHVTTRIFDSNGNFIGFREELITRDEAGRITSRTFITYNAEGKQIGKRTLEYSHRVDQDGKVTATRVIAKNAKGDVLWTSDHTFTRDNTGKVVERDAKFTDAKGNVFRTAVQTYTRNEKGKMTGSTIIRKDGNGDFLQRAEFNFQYDANGKLEKRTETTFLKSGGKQVEVTKIANGVAVSGVKNIYRKDSSGDYELVRTLKISYS